MATVFVPATGVTMTGTPINGQVCTVTRAAGGLGARINPRPLHFFPMGEDGSTGTSTDDTVSRVSKTLTPINSNTFIQSTLKPVNAIGACQAMPQAGTGNPAQAFQGAGVLWFNFSLNADNGLPQQYYWGKRAQFFALQPDNVKFPRIWPSSGIGNVPDAFIGWVGTPSFEFVIKSASGDAGNIHQTGASDTFWPAPHDLNTFFTDETWWQEGTTNNIDGILNAARNSGLAVPWATRWEMGTTANPGPMMGSVLDEYSAGATGSPNGTTDKLVYGAQLIDDSPLQLVISDEGTVFQNVLWSAGAVSFNREIQLQLARSDKAIQFRLRQGSHASLANKYLFAYTGFGTAIYLGTWINVATWMTINPVTGAITGTPTGNENDTVVLTVVDSKGRTTYKRFPLAVTSGPPVCNVSSGPSTTWTQASDQFAFAASPTDVHYVMQFDNWGPMPGGLTMQWQNHDCWQVTNVSRHTEQNGVACYPDVTRGFMFNATAMQQFSNPPASNNWTTLSGMGIANSALIQALIKWFIQQTPTTPSVSRWDCLLDLYWFQTNNPAPSATPFIDISIMQMLMDANYYGPTYGSEHGFVITISGVQYAIIIDESDGFNVFNAAGGHYILVFPRPTSATDGLAANSLWGKQNVTHDIKALAAYFAQSNPVDDNGQPIKNGHTGAVVTAPLVSPSLFFCAANAGVEIDFFQTNTDVIVYREFRVAMQNEPPPP